MVQALAEDSLERVVRAAGIGVPAVWRQETGSTNDDARGLADAGALEWTVVSTAHQTGGRGRLGRTWTDVPGRSLLVSIILRPRIAPDRAGLVSMQAAVSMIAASGITGMRSKWPNDLVVEGRKVGGILGEAQVVGGEMRHLVLGLGLNVGSSPEDFPPELRGTVSSLAAEGGVTAPDELLLEFLRSFRAAYETAEFPAGVVGRYAPICDTIGRVIRVSTAAGAPVEGRAVGLDERGGLLLERDGGRTVVAFGEVEHVR